MNEQDSIIRYQSFGTLSKQEIRLNFTRIATPGIFFRFSDGSKIAATVENLQSAQRNTVLGNQNNALCFVEHLLAVMNLLKINNTEIHIDGSEIPLEDGSGKTWKELLQAIPATQGKQQSFTLSSALSTSDEKNRSVNAIPSDKFKMSYLFTHPVTQEKQWASWETGDDINLLINARTFASKLENEMMGVKDKVLSYDENGFDLEFRHAHEPIYHKLLDLFGDLSLSGVNPFNIKAHFISYMGSHALNTEMARLLFEQWKKS